MLLSAAKKIKKCREHFGISQYKFKQFGINQHYLSMIESGKREPSSDMMKDIYNALYQLTDGKVENLYTKEQFLMTQDDQIRYWFETNYSSIDQKIKEYENYNKILKKYKMFDLIIENDIAIGQFYKEKGEFDLANKFFFQCLKEKEITKLQKSKVYREIALNLRRYSNYKQSWYYCLLALDELEDKTSNEYYQLCFDIGAMYYKLNNFEESNKCVNYLLNHCDVPQFISLGKLLKALILQELGENKEAQKIYKELIQFPVDYTDFMYANFHLSRSYFIEKEYDKALSYSQQALDCSLNDYRRDFIRLLIFRIHKELGNYEEALKYSNLSKKGILSSSILVHVKEWYEESISLFCLLKDYETAKQLLQEVSCHHQFSSLLNEFKLLYLKYLSQENTPIKDLMIEVLNLS